MASLLIVMATYGGLLSMQIDDMIACESSVAPWMASITFGGQDLKTVYVGTLKGTTIPYFTSPVAGLPMVHW
jgi:hypothetical protein